MATCGTELNGGVEQEGKMKLKQMLRWTKDAAGRVVNARTRRCGVAKSTIACEEQYCLRSAVMLPPKRGTAA